MRGLLMLLSFLAFAPAGAQTMYRGYDTGPDFGRMPEQSQRDSAQLSAQMQQQQQQAIARSMQDPECQAHYTSGHKE